VAVATGAGAGACKTTAMLLDIVGSATLVAAIDTVAEEGIAAGAVYRPLAEMVPSRAFPPTTWFTVQLTDWLIEPLTLAAYCAVEPSATVSDPLTDTVTAGAGAAGAAGAVEVVGFGLLALAQAVTRRSTPLTDAATTI
jgi:hypothetical protein